MGDQFSSISGSIIVNKSIIYGAINALKQRDDTAAVLLQQLATVVAESSSREAGEMLESFSEEIQKPQPRKGVLKSSWEGIQRALPAITRMLELTEGIENLIK